MNLRVHLVKVSCVCAFVSVFVYPLKSSDSVMLDYEETGSVLLKGL